MNYTIFSAAVKFVAVYPLLEYASWSVYLIILYILCFLILLTVLMFIYSPYFISKFSANTPWVAKFFCIWLQLLTTFFFVPALGTLLLVFDCTSSSEFTVHSYYPGVRCFAGVYWVHAVLSCLFALAVLGVVVVVSLLLYEARFEPGNTISKVNGKHDVLMLLHKTVLVILLLISKAESKEWVLWIPMLGFSLLLFVNYATKKTYYSFTAHKVHLLYLISNVWLSLVFAWTAALYKYASLDTFTIGLLMLLLATFAKKGPSWETKLGGSRKIRYSHELLDKIFTYAELVLGISKCNEDYSLLIKGYVIYHTKICPASNCSLKKYADAAFDQAEQSVEAKELSPGVQSHGKMESLLLHCSELFAEGLNKFPRDNKLRLFYSLYLIQVPKNDNSALEQLLIVEKSEPDLEEEALTYHYREIIKDRLVSRKDGDANYLNVISIMSYETHQNLFKEGIEVVASLHHQFWTALIDEVPDLKRFRQIGFGIQSSLASLEAHWNCMQEIDPDQAGTLSVYGRFSNEVLNDKELSKQLRERISCSNMRKINVNKQYLKASNGCDLAAISPEGDPCVCVSAQPNKLGTVTNLNNSFCRLFGYQRKELLGANVECLMPEAFAATHEKILREEMQKQGDMSRKDVHIYGKLRSGYVASMWFSLLAHPTVLNESNFIAIIRLDKSASNFDVAELIFDTSKNLVELNSKAITMLHLTLPLIREHKMTFYDLFPEFDVSGPLKKAALTTHFRFPDFSESSEPTRSKQIPVSLSLAPLEMRRTPVGYAARVETAAAPARGPVEVVPPLPFQFWYDRNLNRYVRMFSENELSNSSVAVKKHVPSLSKAEREEELVLEDADILNEFFGRAKNCSSAFMKTAFQRLKLLAERKSLDLDPMADKDLCCLISRQVHDYGKSVTTYRYVKGEYEDVKNSFTVSPNIDDDYELGSRRPKDKQIEKKKSLIASLNIKGRKSIEDLLLQAKNTKLRWTCVSSYLSLLTVFALAIVGYIFLTQFLSLVSSRVKLVDESYQRLVYVQVVFLDAKEMTLVYEYVLAVKFRGHYTAYEKFNSMNKEEYMRGLKSNLTVEATSMYEMHKDLIQRTLELPDFDDYAEYSTKQNIPLFVRINGTKVINDNYSLSESVIKFISSVYIVGHEFSNSNLTADEYMYYILENGKNNLVVALRNSFEFYSDVAFAQP